MDDFASFIAGLADGGAAEQPAPSYFSHYQLLRPIGAGSAASVWHARHVHPGYEDQSFAIKVLHEHLSHDPRVVEMFKREAYYLSLLKHPNVIDTFESGIHDGRLFMTMELVHGHNLGEVLARCENRAVDIPLFARIAIAQHISAALLHAHELCDAQGVRVGLIHRDLNPSNVYVSYDGEVKLGDFGVASALAASDGVRHSVMGRAGYFAPEALAGDAATQLMDVYSFGATLFLLLTGDTLYSDPDEQAVLRENARGRLPKAALARLATLPEAIGGIVRDCLERRLRLRPDSMAVARRLHSVQIETVPALALAAIVRRAFSAEYDAFLQLDASLRSMPIFAAGRGCVDIRADRVDAVAALLSESEFVAGSDAPDVTIAQVGGLAAPSSRVGIPTVAICDSLTPAAVQQASDLRAQELLFAPLTAPALLRALRCARVGRSSSASRRDTKPTGLRVLVVRAERGDLIAERLTLAGHRVQCVSNVRDGVALTDAYSPEAVVVDLPDQPKLAKRYAEVFRSQPGFSVLPVLFLAAGGQAPDVPRTAVLPESASGDEITRALMLLRQHSQHRIFSRYAVSLPVEIRHAGSVVKGKAQDLSRLGMNLVLGAEVLPQNAAVGLSFHPPMASDRVDVSARVLRVSMNQPEDPSCVLAVVFESFAPGSEPRLIDYLATLPEPVG
jgi:hypothetical protein